MYRDSPFVQEHQRPQSEVKRPRAGSAEPLELDEIWRSLMAGRHVVVASHCDEDRCFLRLVPALRPRAASAHAEAILQSVLAGESQKSRALALGLSVSTVASHCSAVLRAIGCGRLASRAPIALVMAAQAAAGARLGPALRERQPDHSSECELVSTEIPGNELRRTLTSAEWLVARAAIEGKTYAEIGVGRGTSPRTVANQLAAVFRKLGVCGRSDLRAKVVRDHARSLPLTETQTMVQAEAWDLAI